MTQTPATISPAPSALEASSALRIPHSAFPPPRARQLFAFCTQIVICATLSLMTWIGEACLTRDPGLKRFRLLKRYFDLTLKVFRTVRDKPERLTPAQLGWLRRAAETIHYLFGRPLDFSPLDELAKPAQKPAPGDPAHPASSSDLQVRRPGGPSRPRAALRTSSPPVPDELDAKYVQAPGRVLATVCANLARLMGAALPVAPVHERIGQELALAQKEPAPQSVSVLGGAAFTRTVFEFIPPAPSSISASPVPQHHPPP